MKGTFTAALSSIAIVTAMATSALTYGVALGIDRALREDELARLTGVIAAFVQVAAVDPSPSMLDSLASALSDNRHALRLTPESGGADPGWQGSRTLSTRCLSLSPATCLRAEVVWSPGLAMLGRDNLVLLVMGSLAAWICALVATHYLLYRSFVTPLAARLQELEDVRERARALDMLLHDIRRPFRAIKRVIEAAAAKPASSTQATLNEALPRLDAIIHEAEAMLRSARPRGSARADAAFTAHCPEEVLDSAFLQCLASLAGADIEFSYRLTHVRMLRVDFGLVTRLIANLIGNAAEAMERRGTIWFATEEMDRDGEPRLRLTVGNSGSYIDEATRSRLFTPFFTKGKADGTGLGLAFVKKVVELHGGAVTLQSDRELGTEFSLDLPVAPTGLSAYKGRLAAHARELPGTAPEPTKVDHRRPRLVLVEDDPFVSEAWQVVCTDATLDVYSRPEDFLASLDRDPTLLRDAVAVVTDYYFGPSSTYDGEKLADAVRKIWRGPIILSSASVLRDWANHPSIDLVIEKEAMPWQILARLVEAARSQSKSA